MEECGRGLGRVLQKPWSPANRGTLLGAWETRMPREMHNGSPAWKPTKEAALLSLCWELDSKVTGKVGWQRTFKEDNIQGIEC